MAEFITLDVTDGIGTIRINRPPVNALNTQAIRELEHVAKAAAQNEQIRAVIVYGGEKVFSAGLDITEAAAISAAQMTVMSANLQAGLGCLAEIPKPTVAAISGYALGGGLEIALAADHRIIGDNVKLGLPEILLGIIPGGGGTQRLARLIGVSRAKDMIFTGRFVGPDEALAIGLVDQVVAPDDVYSAAQSWAKQFVRGPAKALAAAKHAIDHGLSGDLAAGLEAERRSFAELFATQDGQIGMASFIAHGPGSAEFTGH